MRLLNARSSGALLVLALLAGCGSVDTVVAQAGPTATATPAGQTADERTIAIYSAVIRRVITRDHTFGSAKSPFRHISVVDHPVGKRGDFTDEQRSGGEPFGDAIREGLRRELADLPPLEFVARSSDARVLDGFPRPKHKDGVVLTLSVIEGPGHRVEVPNRMWCSGLCGQGLTYVLRYEHGEWAITGTTGPYLIS